MTVHSNDGESWLTKLDRIGELSAKNKEMTFNNVGHLINADMLKEQYWKLDRTKAVGIDKVTKEAYGLHLDKNIKTLIKRIRRATYKPKPTRITEIPKEDGSTRPLAISCIEDKLVQLAASSILGKIYDPVFLTCSYGFRPGRNCHDALKALMTSTFPNIKGAIVEIDIKKYFNTIPHGMMMKFLKKKISDRRFLSLVSTLITAPIINGKVVETNKSGCPQGSIVSPILANIYLHHVIDKWFELIKTTHIRGRAELIRYADDMVFTFEHKTEAERFYKTLPKRLAKYGLELHSGKSQIIPSGIYYAEQAHQKGLRIPTYKFLGFTCYWGRSKRGYWRLKYKSRKDRFATKLKGLRKYLWNNLNPESHKDILKVVNRVVTGWINYHNISDNSRMVEAFRMQCMRIIFKWLNRRGRRHPISWVKFNRIMDAVKFPKAGKVTSMFPSH